jgi:hypothetical protein
MLKISQKAAKMERLADNVKRGMGEDRRPKGLVPGGEDYLRQFAV